jgi:hypothetical protein
MTEWDFVAAAYAVMLLATAGLLAWAFTSMRRAEAAADTFKRRD